MSIVQAMASSYNAFHNYSSAFHSLKQKKNNFSKQAKAFEEKYTQEKSASKKAKDEVADKDKQIMKLNGKLSEFNKKTFDVKKKAVEQFKGSAKFEYEKGGQAR